MKDIKTELRCWARETFEKYSELIKQNPEEQKPEYDLGFYQQSPLDGIDSSVEIIVMGINPGSGGTFSNMQRSDSEWKLTDVEAKDTHLLRGNIKWNERSNWAFIRNTRRLLSSLNLDEERDVVYTNSTFFNTPKARQLMDDLILRTLPSTLELITILSPKVVLCLSGFRCFKFLERISGGGFKYRSVLGNALLLGDYNGRKYVGIYHPAYYYSSALTDFMKKAIKIVYDNNSKDISDLIEKINRDCSQEIKNVKERVKAPKMSVSIAKEVLETMKDFCSFDTVDETDKMMSFSVSGLVKVCVVAQSSKQYVYWRHTDFNGKCHYDGQTQNYPYTNEIRAILKKHGYTNLNEPTSLAAKPMNSYGVTPEEIVNNLKNEILAAGHEIETLLS